MHRQSKNVGLEVDGRNCAKANRATHMLGAGLTDEMLGQGGEAAQTQTTILRQLRSNTAAGRVCCLTMSIGIGG